MFEALVDAPVQDARPTLANLHPIAEAGHSANVASSAIGGGTADAVGGAAGGVGMWVGQRWIGWSRADNGLTGFER